MDSIGTPQLRSACSGTSCVAVDVNDNFTRTTDGGADWTTLTPMNASLSGIESVACANASLCVAGDGIGDASTFTVPPTLGKPSLAGTAKVGSRLTLTHASTVLPSVWRYDDWRRCDNPDATCSLDPISTSPTGYTLVAADAHEYIDAREVIGFGFEEEGPIVSNSVGPIAALTTGGGGGGTKPGTVKFAGGGSTSKGVVTISLACTGGACNGKVKLTTKTGLGSASYLIAKGKTAKVKIKLNKTGKKQLKKHHGKLTVRLVISPNSGKSTTVSIHLKVKH